MPITKSAKKALRQNIKRRLQNQRIKRKIKTLIKKMDVLVFEKKINEGEKLLPLIYKIIDKAAKTNLIKKNTASRKKSKIAKSLNSSNK